MSTQTGSATTAPQDAAIAQAPQGATNAVLKPSDPVPDGAQEVRGVEFNDYAGRSITVEELVGGMENMGFQATSVGQAVKVIEGMVRQIALSLPFPHSDHVIANLERCRDGRGHHHLPRLHLQPHFVWLARDAALPRAAQACVSHCDDGRWRRRGLYQMSCTNLSRLFPHRRRIPTRQGHEPHRQLGRAEQQLLRLRRLGRADHGRYARRAGG